MCVHACVIYGAVRTADMMHTRMERMRRGGGIRIDRHVILFLSNVGQFTGEQRTRTEVRELVNSENLRECEVLQVECRSCF